MAAAVKTPVGKAPAGKTPAAARAGIDLTYQLTGLRPTNSVTLIEPVQPTGNAVTGTGLNNVNVTVPSTAGGNDYILQISTDPGFSNAQTYAAAPGSYSATPSNPTNQGVTLSTATGTAVVFNNINVTAAFPNGTAFFYRVGARDSSNNGQAGFSNPYIFSDPLTLSVSGITSACAGSAAVAPASIGATNEPAFREETLDAYHQSTHIAETLSGAGAGPRHDLPARQRPADRRAGAGHRRGRPGRAGAAVRTARRDHDPHSQTAPAPVGPIHTILLFPLTNDLACLRRELRLQPG